MNYTNKLTMHLITKFLFLFSLTSIYCCTDPAPPVKPVNPCLKNGVDTCVVATKVDQTISVDLNTTHQTIHSFGASDCWHIKMIGKNWPVEKRNRIADLLFSKDFDANGNPKGIGLSMWRVNLGSGSFEQGVNSKITSAWRREECFQDASGNYNWNKQAGNQWFAKAAKARGVENLLLFSLTPPVHMSKNGLASSSEKGNLNIKPDMYDDYADFMAEACKYFNNNGMPINYISPINEPQWDWVLNESGFASQEGSPATNAQAFNLIKNLNQKLEEKNVNTKIAYGEVGNNAMFYGGNNSNANVFNYFANPNSSGYIMNLPKVAKVMSAHSYFSQSNVSQLVTNRVSVNSRVNSVNPNIEYWQTEYCILNNEDNTQGNGRDLGIESALYISRVIHFDLAVANASSWQWWLGVSLGDYKDGLVYVADPAGQMGELPATEKDGVIYTSKMLWAMGNFSRFIRPGMQRVEVKNDKYADLNLAANGTMVSAYKNATTNELVIVVVNMSREAETIKLNGVNYKANTLKAYSTSGSTDLKSRNVEVTGNLVVEPRSVTTFVGKY